MAALSIFAPYDNALLGEVPITPSAEVERSLADAAAKFADRKQWLPAEQRIAVLRRAAELLQARAEPVALAAAREGGKPLVDSRIEVARAIDGLMSCAEVLRTQGGQGVPMQLNAASAERVAFTTWEPVGPILGISAFNHPLNNVVHQVGPAIAAGCPVRLKPAPATPLTARSFIDLLQDAGLPPGWCELLIPEDNAQVQALAADPRWGLVSFIGSSEVGWGLRQQLAPGVRLLAELGGAAPVVVDESADLADLVPRLAKGGFYHAGQVCVSVQRVFAHESIARELAEKLARQASQMRVGDPTRDDTQVGPLIRRASVARIEEWIKEALDGGGKALVGARALSASCYAPTVLWDPPASARVSRAEVFGPLVSVYPVPSLEVAIARANSLPFAFQAAVFSRNLDAALHAYQGLRAAAVMVNDHTAFRVDWMPFGGWGISGLGVGGIPYTFREMQREKLCVIRSPGLKP